jgi:hypothetical protein
VIQFCDFDCLPVLTVSATEPCYTFTCCHHKYTFPLYVSHANSCSCKHQLNKPTHLLIHDNFKIMADRWRNSLPHFHCSLLLSILFLHRCQTVNHSSHTHFIIQGSLFFLVYCVISMLALSNYLSFGSSYAEMSVSFRQAGKLSNFSQTPFISVLHNK